MSLSSLFRLSLSLICLLSAGRLLAQTTKLPVAGSFSRLPSGTEYQLFRKDAGGRYQPRPLAPAADAPYPQRAGQVLLLQLEYRTGRDSVLMASRRVQSGQPVPLLLPAQPASASMEEGSIGPDTPILFDMEIVGISQ